jgi:NADH-quinone oxidoreductase subunit H
MWVRWTLPRLRFDQLMKLAWRGMIPLMIVMMVVVGVMTWLGLTQWWMFTLANVIVAVAAALISPLLPAGPPVNRRVQLAGSRFSPLEQSTEV